jgi:hypothetical protein
MKIVISESQYKRLIETKEKPKILKIPSLKVFNLKVFNDDWFLFQKFLENKGNTPQSVGGDLDLRYTSIKSLGNLISVEGRLDLEGTPIQSLGSLQSVGGDLALYGTPIQSFGNLTSVGGDLTLHRTPLSIYTREQIREMINVEGRIYK